MRISLPPVRCIDNMEMSTHNTGCICSTNRRLPEAEKQGLDFLILDYLDFLDWWLRFRPSFHIYIQ